MNGPFERHSTVTDAAGCDWRPHGGRMEGHSTFRDASSFPAALTGSHRMAAICTSPTDDLLAT
jgi:hypothetical protein